MSAGQNKSLMRKRAARLATAQALYSVALTQQNTKPETMIKHIVQSWADSKTNDARDLPYDVQPELALLTRLVKKAMSSAEEIEAVIEGMVLPNWKKTRMSLPLLATLRACGAEALAFPAKKRGLIAREYTEVAAQLVSDEELAYAHKGFNILLDALSSETAA